MKIVLINNLYGRAARGGAERVVEAEASAFSAAGHDVIVVTLGHAERGQTPRIFEVRAPNLFFYDDLVRHSAPARLSWHLIDIFNFSSAHRVAKIIAAENPDVAHTHNLTGLGFMIPSAIRRLGIPRAHTLHDAQLLHPSGLLTEASARAPRSWPQKTYIALMRRLMGSPDVVISPSRFLLEAHLGNGFFPKSRAVILPNPVPPLELRSLDPSIPRPLHPTFLFAGQLEPHKGIMDLLDVWPDISGACPGATIEIAGDGSLADEVRRRSQTMSGVFARGLLSADVLADAMRRADFVVVPSRIVENAPTVITEAMARGTPVIASRIGGIPELVREGVNGFMFAPGDHDALAAALRQACAAMPRWSRLSEASRSSMAGRSADDHVAALLKLYASL